MNDHTTESWEEAFEKICGEDMYGETAYSGWTNTAEDIKEFIRSLLADRIEKDNVRRVIADLKTTHGNPIFTDHNAAIATIIERALLGDNPNS